MRYRVDAPTIFVLKSGDEITLEAGAVFWCDFAIDTDGFALLPGEHPRMRNHAGRDALLSVKHTAHALDPDRPQMSGPWRPLTDEKRKWPPKAPQV